MAVANRRVVAAVSARALIGARDAGVTHAGRKPHFAITSRRPLALAVMMGTVWEWAAL